MKASKNTPLGAQISTRRSRRARIAVAVGFAVVVLAGACAAAWMLSGGAGGFSYDPASRSGQVPTKTPEEVQAELDRVVGEGMFNISIASTIDFPSPGAPGMAYIENVPANRYDMQASIALDDTGEQIYASGPLAPGTYIEAIELVRALAPGSHAATATFTALDRETHDVVGHAAARVTLVVGEG